MIRRIPLDDDIRIRIDELVSWNSTEDLYTRVEEILSDYASNRKVLDDLPKAAETRDKLISISKQAQKLSKSLDSLHRLARMELAPVLDTEFFESLSSKADRLAAAYDGQPTTRVDTTNARDFAVTDLIELYCNFAPHGADNEWLDRCEEFISIAIRHANKELPDNLKIPLPKINDTSKGEANQGKLRVKIKQYLKENRPQ